MKSLCMQSVPPFLECGAFIERNEQDDKMNLLGLNTFLFLVPLCLGSIPGFGRSPGEGIGNPLQYSCLENSMDGGPW